MKRGLALVAAALLAACSHATSTSTAAGGATGATPSALATNPTDFPLYEGSAILSTRDWTQTISSSAAGAGGGIFSQGAGTYSGHEVVAHTTATMSQLHDWLDSLEKTPPSGYGTVVTGSSVESARSRAQAVGIDFDAFQKTVDGKQHGVLVLAIDPALLQTKAGPILSVLSKYNMVPQSFRDPIDAQAKARTGFTISEALSPNTPIGAALGALNQLHATGDRGVMVIDATKH